MSVPKKIVIIAGPNGAGKTTFARKSLHNFNRVFRPIVDSWVLYDNSASAPRLLAAGDNPP